MNRSHRRWLTDEAVFDLGDESAAKDEYGLTPEADWSQVYECQAAIQIMGAHEQSDQREVQETRWILVIEPPKYAVLKNDMRVNFRDINGVVETVEAKYDRHGNLDRIKVVAMEVG